MNRLVLVLSVCLIFACHHVFGDAIDDIINSTAVPTGWSQKNYQDFKSQTNKYARAIQSDVQKDAKDGRGRVMDLTNNRIDNMVKLAAQELRKVGRDKEAGKILSDWQNKYYGFVYHLGSREIGEHEGIQFLLSIYATLQSFIPEEVLEATHLKDIWWMAYCIPMVFQCLDNVDIGEYEKHWDRFLGIIGYWTADIACLVYVQVPMVCGMVGEVVQKICMEVVGPLTVKFPYKWACN